LTGNGWATKEDVARRLSDLFEIPFEKLVEVTYYKQGIKAGQIKSYIADGSDALGLAIALPIMLKRQGVKLDYAGISR
jgi:ATP-dependent protease HslVU (ClpYQ) ATPase subunit